MTYYLDMTPFGDKGEALNLMPLTPDQVDELSDAGFLAHIYDADGEPFRVMRPE